MDSEISNKLNADPNNKTETAQQKDVEEHAMMAWETFDSSTIDNMEEEKLKADETKLEDAEDDEFIFCGLKLKFHEIILGGQMNQKMLCICNTTVKMKILMILHLLIV